MSLDKEIARINQRHVALLKAPDARKLADLEFEAAKLLDTHPDHPVLLFTVGTLAQRNERPGTAIALLEKAIAKGMEGPEPHVNIGGCHKLDHRDLSAAQSYERAIVICDSLDRRNAKRARNGKEPYADPVAIRENRLSALHGMASLYVNAGKPEKVIEWSDRALAIDPEDRFALWNKGLGLLESGQWSEGFRLYDVAGFMPGQSTKPIERKLKDYGGLPKWDGTPGKTVICYGEQGVGDEIMFASMLPDLMRDVRVIIDCDKRLETLFKRAFPDAVAVYPTSDRDAAFDWIKNHAVDAWVPMGSLGRYYRPDAKSFPRTPYLTPDPAKVARWRDDLASYRGLRVGISWAGGLKKTRFDQRSIPLAAWADILRVPGVDWFSLQYHPQAPDEAAQVGASIGVPIHHWGDMIASYAETAAFLQSLDLVISVNTSLVHLAGALGVRTWCLTPVMCAWRYQCAGPNPWYGSVEMVRQRVAGEWKPILATVAAALRSEVNAREAA